MKPPKEKFIAYSEQEWREIKRVLARVGVGADTVQVKGQPLRVELQWQRLRYDELADLKLPTTRQLQTVVNKAIAATVSFRDIFAPRTTVAYYTGDDMAAEAREVLDRLEAKLRSAVVTEGRDFSVIAQVGSEMVLEEGDGPNKNARKGARDRYWSNLGKIWMAIVPTATRRQRLFEFVRACTGESEPAIRSYFDRKRASK